MTIFYIVSAFSLKSKTSFWVFFLHDNRESTLTAFCSVAPADLGKANLTKEGVHVIIHVLLFQINEKTTSFSNCIKQIKNRFFFILSVFLLQDTLETRKMS